MPLNPAWKIAFGAASAFSTHPRKAEELEQGWSETDNMTRRRAHRLLQAWIRERGLMREAMRPFLRRPPRPAVQTFLELAATELSISDEERHPAIVHHAVEASKTLLSKGESGLVNAIMRRLAKMRPKVNLRFSHPAWLVERWEHQFGLEATAELLAWNQKEAPTYIRWAARSDPPENLIPTQWPEFFSIEGTLSSILPAVEKGEAYIQDPFSRHPVHLALEGSPLHTLDLCAAPGGKSRALLDAGHPDMHLLAVDLPGLRAERLRENLAAAPAPDRVKIFTADVCTLRTEDLVANGHPAFYDAVVLDVPCSNTGVIGRRPDVRWVLKPNTITDLLPLQAQLLDAAARWVAPGGKLVYSTCSLEAEENEEQITAFLQRHPDFEAGEPRLSRPWIDGHDGGAAFPLTRVQRPK